MLVASKIRLVVLTCPDRASPERLAKSRLQNSANLESLWMNNHLYKVPEFLVIDISHSSKEYQKWVKKNCLG